MCILIGYTKLSVNITILIITIIVYSLISYIFGGIDSTYAHLLESSNTNSLHLKEVKTKEENVIMAGAVSVVQENVSINTSSSEEQTAVNGIWQIEAPRIKLKAPIASGTTEKVMNKDVGHFKNTSKWKGNVGLAAHNRRLPSKLF